MDAKWYKIYHVHGCVLIIFVRHLVHLDTSQKVSRVQMFSCFRYTSSSSANPQVQGGCVQEASFPIRHCSFCGRMCLCGILWHFVCLLQPATGKICKTHPC